ncbi:MAG: hypothetical protein M0C28_23210 [Candidatus Moduliflexus flocculans]|nr:hypothetical protein [Candidatus Moduliflexus flocculans]
MGYATREREDAARSRRKAGEPGCRADGRGARWTRPIRSPVRCTCYTLGEPAGRREGVHRLDPVRRRPADRRGERLRAGAAGRATLTREPRRTPAATASRAAGPEPGTPRAPTARPRGRVGRRRAGARGR